MSSHAATVLVVDDDPHIVLGLEKHLTHAGFRVLTGSSVDDALTKARAFPVDAIILDVNAPDDRTGLDAARTLQQDPRTASIPVVFVTGAADERFQDRCRAAGGRYFISKPYEGALVVQLLCGIFAKDELAEVRRISRAKRRQPVY